MIKFIKYIYGKYSKFFTYFLFIGGVFIFYYIYIRYNYTYFSEHNISYGAYEKLKKINVLWDWNILEHRDHLRYIRKVFFLDDRRHSFKIFSSGMFPLWSMYMSDLYFWCYNPMSFFIKILKMLEVEESGSSFSFVIDDIYKARQAVFIKEREFYYNIRANARHISMDDFMFHSVHHHWLILQMKNDFVLYMNAHIEQKCREIPFKSCYDTMFAIDYLNYHIALAQAKIDTIKTYNVDLDLLKGFEDDLKDFLKLKADLKIYACGNKTTTIEELHYISKADFKNLNCQTAFYNKAFEKFLINETFEFKLKKK